LTTLATNVESGAISRDRADRLRAVLLTARAMELEGGKPDEARSLAYEAHRLAPGLAPATVLAARLLTRNGEVRRAMRVLESGWRSFAHPDIADAYAMVRPGDSVRERLKRVRRLADLRPSEPEGAMAVARAGIDARDWASARAALSPFVQTGPTERMCLLMAEIEDGENGDQGRARTWLRRAVVAKRDPAWTADGRVFDSWAPVSPISGRLDAFEWRVVADGAPAARALLAADEGSEISAGTGRDVALPMPAPATPASRRDLAARPPLPTISAEGARIVPDDPGSPAEPLPPGKPIL
jgi:HemY protein